MRRSSLTAGPIRTVIAGQQRYIPLVLLPPPGGVTGNGKDTCTNSPILRFPPVPRSPSRASHGRSGPPFVTPPRTRLAFRANTSSA